MIYPYAEGDVVFKSGRKLELKNPEEIDPNTTNFTDSTAYELHATGEVLLAQIPIIGDWLRDWAINKVKDEVAKKPELQGLTLTYFETIDKGPVHIINRQYEFVWQFVTPSVTGMIAPIAVAILLSVIVSIVTSILYLVLLGFGFFAVFKAIQWAQSINFGELVTGMGIAVGGAAMGSFMPEKLKIVSVVPVGVGLYIALRQFFEGAPPSPPGGGAQIISVNVIKQ